MLRVLMIIKRGLTGTSWTGMSYEVLPPLEAYKIFWNCDLEIVGSHLTKDTIGPPVNKAIAYLQELSLPKWKIDLWLNAT